MEVKEEVDLFIKSVNVRDLSELSGSLSLLTSARAGKSGSMTVHLPSPTFLLETPHSLPQIPPLFHLSVQGIWSCSKEKPCRGHDFPVFCNPAFIVDSICKYSNNANHNSDQCMF